MSKLSDIKKIIFSSEEIEVKAMDLVDSNGTEIHVVTAVEGELSVDDVVLVKDENGEDMPAPDGEYTITDLNKILVVSEGKISEIKDVEAEEMQEETTVETEVVEKAEEVVTELETKIEELVDVVSEMFKKVQKLETEVEKIGKFPAGEQKKPEKVGFQKRVAEDFSESEKRMSSVTEFIKNIKLKN